MDELEERGMAAIYDLVRCDTCFVLTTKTRHLYFC